MDVGVGHGWGQAAGYDGRFEDFLATVGANQAATGSDVITEDFMDPSMADAETVEYGLTRFEWGVRRQSLGPAHVNNTRPDNAVCRTVRPKLFRVADSGMAGQTAQTVLSWRFPITPGGPPDGYANLQLGSPPAVGSPYASSPPVGHNDCTGSGNSAGQRPVYWFYGPSSSDSGVFPPGPTLDIPGYECGRVLSEAGGDRYFARLKAIGPSLPVPEGGGDEWFWSVDWSTDTYGGREVEVLTPPLTDMPPGGWVATFHSSRTFPVGEVGDKEFAESIDWGAWESEDDGIGGFIWWFVPEYQRDVVEGLEERVESRMRFFGSEDEPLTQADIEGTEQYSSVQIECPLLVDPTRPGEGTRGSTHIEIYNPPGYEPAPDSAFGDDGGGESGSDDCMDGVGLRLSWNPLTTIGSALNTIVKPLLCGLKALFIPEDLDWDGLWAGVQTGFPFSVVAEVAAVFDAIFDLVGGGLAAGGCVTVDATDAVPFAADYSATVELEMPAPTGSGCAGAGGDVGDLFGYRALFRNLMAGSLWIGVLVRFSGSVGPKGNQLEVPV